MIGEYFQGLKAKVRELQANVMENIKQSENLRNLELTLEKSKEFIQLDPSLPDHFEREKQIFDEKLKKGRYAFVVKKRDFYNNLIENLEKSRQKINVTIDKSIEYQERVLRVNDDPQFLQQKITEIVQDCVIIDPPHVDS
jgi:CRISPR/Cas system Type II protein with McrA/HNH and RuvC-like nuclease domain